MENLKKQIKQIFKERGWEGRDYQVRNILNYTNPKKPHVTAVGTGGGKTILTAARFELYYMCGIIKPNEKVVIIPADKTILRGNFKKQFDAFKPKNFTYSVIEDKIQLVEAIENNTQIIIALPQFLKDYAKLLKNVKWLVVDEAHKWYFAPTIKGIIKDCKPKYQSLLTGTPFKFNRYKNDFIIDYTSVSTLYKLGYADDVNMQVLHTSLLLTRLDWSSMTGNLRDDKKFTKKEIDKNLSEMILELVKKVKLPIKDLSSVHNITKNIASKLFGKLQKTIIFTHRTDAANVVAEYLRLHGVNCIVSHSNIDGEIAEESFDEFRKDDKIKVMVSVNRGKEGFDFPELYNIIDMTYSQNFEVVMQMIGRLLRPSKKKTYKVFYKVAPNNTAGYFTDWMDCLIQLFDDKWYQDFNGRNMLDVTVPNALLSRPKGEKQPTYIQDGKNKIEIASGSSLTKGTKIQIMKNGKKTPLKDGTYKIPQTPTTENPKPSPIEIEVKNGVITKTPVRTTRGRFRPKVLNDMGFDLSLSFMEKNDWFRLEDPLSTVATTSLNKIMLKYDLRKRIRSYSDRDIEDFFKENEGGYLPILRGDYLAEKGLPRKHYVKAAEQKGILNELIKKYNIKTAPERNYAGWYKNDEILKKLIEECNYSSKEFQKKYTHIFQDMGREYLTNLGLKFHQRQNKSFENYDYCMSIALEKNNDGTRKYPNIRSTKSLGIYRGMKKQGLWEKFKSEAWS